MGQNRKNIEAVTDYADGRHFLRLHRDILLPADICEAVRRHLNAGRWDAAKCLALEHAPADAQDEIQLSLTTLRNAARPRNQAGRGDARGRF